MADDFSSLMWRQKALMAALATPSTPQECKEQGGCFGLPAGLPLRCYDATRMSKTTPPVVYKSMGDMFVCGLNVAGTSEDVIASSEAAAQRRQDYYMTCPAPGTVPGYHTQAKNTKTCTPQIVVYQGECTSPVVDCLLFKKPIYTGAQRQLNKLLAAKPDPADAARAATWCRDVLFTVAKALDATNLRQEFFSPWANTPPEVPEGIDIFKSIRTWQQQFRERAGQQFAQALTLPLLIPMVPSLGGDLMGSDASLQPMAGDRSRDSGPSPHGTWAINRQGPGRGWSVHSGKHIPDSLRGWPKAQQIAASKLGTRDYLELLFREHPRDDLVPTQYHWRECMDKTIFGHVCGKERRPAFLVSGPALIDWCATWAKFITTTSLEQIVTEGLTNWLGQISWFAANGQLSLNPDQMHEMFEDVARNRGRAATEQMGMAAGVVGAVGGMLGALFVTVVMFIVRFFIEVLPMAYGYSCPMPPFKRTAEDCGGTQLQGVDINQIIQEMDRIAIAGGIDRPWAPVPGPTGPEILPFDLSPREDEEEEAPSYGKYIVGGAVLIGGALVVRRLLQR